MCSDSELTLELRSTPVSLRFFHTFHTKSNHDLLLTAHNMAGWSNNVLNRFKAVPDNPRENDFYAPYNKLLSILFPADSQYTVAPQANPYNNSKESVDFIIEFHVFYDAVPVFVVEVKGPSALVYPSTREEADVQMRGRLRDLVGQCPLSNLRGVSAIGTKLCFYTARQTGNNLTVEPQRIPADPQLTTDTAPQSRWDVDVLEEDGFIRLTEVVSMIKKECETLYGELAIMLRKGASN
jgi:hypothetical protein